MPNLFSGFPVSRAKIAEQISGSAPPINHVTNHENGGTDEISLAGLTIPSHVSQHEIGGSDEISLTGLDVPLHAIQHESGGSDELDLTGLTGAGGGFNIENRFISTIFESLDSFKTVVTGSGSITLNFIGLFIRTYSTSGSLASLYKTFDRFNPELTFNKNTKFTFDLELTRRGTTGPDIYIVYGHLAASNHIGFYISGNNLYGSCGNGTTHTTVLLTTLPSPDASTKLTLYCDFVPATSCDFYVNGTLENTISSNLPSGTSISDKLCHLRIDNLTEAADSYILAQNFKFQQDI